MKITTVLLFTIFTICFVTVLYLVVMIYTVSRQVIGGTSSTDTLYSPLPIPMPVPTPTQ